MSRLPHAPLLVASIVVLAFFVLLNPPGSAPRVEAGTEVTNGQPFARPASDDFSMFEAVPYSETVPPQYQAAQMLLLKTGPDDRYMSIAQIGRGSRVEVVGRNEKGDWLAISLNPGSKLYGWVKVATVSGVSNVKTLPVAPVKSLP